MRTNVFRTFSPRVLPTAHNVYEKHFYGSYDDRGNILN